MNIPTHQQPVLIPVLTVVWAMGALFLLYSTAQPALMIVLLCIPLVGLVGLQLPFALAVGFVLFSFFRIHEAFPVMSPLHIPKMLSLGATASFLWLLLQRKVTLFWTPEMTCFALFFVHCTLGMLLAQNRPIATAYWSGIFLKIAFMVFIIAYLTQAPRQLRWIGRLIIITGMTIGYVAISNKLNGIGLVEETRVTISRDIGSVLGDPNDLALTLLFPFSFALTLALRCDTRKLDRVIGILGIFLIAWAIICTQSRGGLLGMATVIGVFTWYRVKSKALLIAGGLLALMVLFTLAGINDRASGGAHEAGIDESANIRLHAWTAAFNMAVSHPLFGVGLDNYYVNFFFYSDFWDNKNHAVHSTWFGVMGETGFVGFAFFIMMVIKLLRTALIVRRETQQPTRENRHAVSISVTSESLLAGIASFIVSGTFLTQGFTWPIYILMALTVAVKRMQQTNTAHTDAA